MNAATTTRSRVIELTRKYVACLETEAKVNAAYKTALFQLKSPHELQPLYADRTRAAVERSCVALALADEVAFKIGLDTIYINRYRELRLKALEAERQYIEAKTEHVEIEPFKAAWHEAERECLRTALEYADSNTRHLQ